MRLRTLIIFCIALAAGFPSFAGEYRDVTPADRVKLPEDLYFREDYRVQWWYLTGHLRDRSGREFGYELTFFVVGVQTRAYASRFGVNRIYISHFAVTDVSGGRFHYTDLADSGAFGFAAADAARLRVQVGKNALEGSQEHFRVEAADDEKSLDLVMLPRKPPVLHGMGGYSRKSASSPLDASLYFSYTSLPTQGTLRFGRNTFTVEGSSWFDREISTRGLAGGLAGWDWFALMLDDGREVMLYVLRTADGSGDPSSSGTMVYRDGTSRHLRASEFRVTVKDRYRSKKTGARYPSRWVISIPSEKLDLTVTPLVQDQEFVAAGTTFNSYWEGACRVEGASPGRAYVELAGYAK